MRLIVAKCVPVALNQELGYVEKPACDAGGSHRFVAREGQLRDDKRRRKDPIGISSSCGYLDPLKGDVDTFCCSKSGSIHSHWSCGRSECRGKCNGCS